MKITDNLRRSSMTLVFSNLSLVIGVLVFGYSLFSLMLIYWFENIVIGVFNVFKILLAKMPVPENSNLSINGKKLVGKINVIPLAFFFLVHYGIFTFVHGIFVFVLFSGYGLDSFTVIYGLLAVSISHTVSFFTNYLGAEEYKKSNPAELFQAPYRRIVVLHLSIIAAGFLIGLTGASGIFLVAFIIFKTVIDFVAHVKEHNFLNKPEGRKIS